MHVCIVGAGPLGRVYGVRLALLARETVSFVACGDEAMDAIAIERVDGEAHTLVHPHGTRAIPHDADIALVCTRAEQVEDARRVLDDGPAIPAIVFAPMMPRTYDALRHRVIAAMPGVTAYGAPTRYWIPRTLTTLLDEPRASDAAIDALVLALNQAGMPARFALGVHEQSPATAVTLLPITMALAIAGDTEALLDDSSLLDDTLQALDEASAIAGTIGRAASWIGMLKIASALPIKLSVAFAKKRAPEGFRCAEAFARRTHAQSAFLAAEALAIASAKNIDARALASLADRMNDARVLASS